MSARQKARVCILVRHEPRRPDLLGPLSEMGHSRRLKHLAAAITLNADIRLRCNICRNGPLCDVERRSAMCDSGAPRLCGELGIEALGQC
jgi:hypothetical protein